MKTLDTHNKEKRSILTKEYKAGVACDSCSEELEYLNPNMQLTSYPAQMSVSCSNADCEQYRKILYKVV